MGGGQAQAGTGGTPNQPFNLGTATGQTPGITTGQQPQGQGLNIGGPVGKSGNPEFRVPSIEKNTIGNWYDFQNNELNRFVAGNPLLSAGQADALNYNSQLPGMLGQFPGFQQQLVNYQNQIGGYQDQLGGYQSQLGGLFGQIPGLQSQAQNQFFGLNNRLGGLGAQLGNQESTLGGWLNGPNGPAGIINSGGALTNQQSRDVSQQTRAIEAAQGTAQSSGALGNELLNRDQYQQQRYNTALQQGQGLEGQISGLRGQQAGLLGLRGQLAGQNAGIQSGLLGLGSNLIGQGAGIAGQGAGLSGLGASLTGQNAGLLGQEQGLQTGGLNQLYGAANANTQNFTGLENPILSYLGNLYGGNQQAGIANAQIQAQQQQASSNKSSGLVSGGAGIIGAAIPAIIGL